MVITERTTADTGPLGFTLLELMLVVFVVGIIAALAMPSLVIQDDRQILRESAEGLLTQMQLQEEEAVLTGTQRGLKLSRLDGGGIALGYQWLLWSAEDRQWLDAPNQIRQLQGDLKGVYDFELLIDGQPVVVAANSAAPVLGGAMKNAKAIGGAKKLSTPQIVIFSSGDVTDFELRFSSADAAASVTLLGNYEGISLRDDRDLAASE